MVTIWMCTQVNCFFEPTQTRVSTSLTHVNIDYWINLSHCTIRTILMMATSAKNCRDFQARKSIKWKRWLGWGLDGNQESCGCRHIASLLAVIKCFCLACALRPCTGRSSCRKLNGPRYDIESAATIDGTRFLCRPLLCCTSFSIESSELKPWSLLLLFELLTFDELPAEWLCAMREIKKFHIIFTKFLIIVRIAMHFLSPLKRNASPPKSEKGPRCARPHKLRRHAKKQWSQEAKSKAIGARTVLLNFERNYTGQMWW